MLDRVNVYNDGGMERKTGEGAAETWNECESDVRIGREVWGDVGDCGGLAPFPRGREKALKSPS